MPHQPPLFPIASKHRTPSTPPPADELAARRILAALWPDVEPYVGTSMTQTAWKQRNKNVALDLARAGVSIWRIQNARRHACERLGEGVYSLRIIQDQVARDSARTAPRPNAREDLPAADAAFLETLK